VSLALLQEHLALWEVKPELRAVYRVWFEAVLAIAPRGGRVIELGAGPGRLGKYAARTRPDLRWVATELLPTPWNDVVADGLRLPFRTGCADAVVGLDVMHHVARPADLFREASRVLKAGGRLAFVEPWVTPLSHVIYRYFHQESCDMECDPWEPFRAAGGTEKDAFEGNAAVLKRLVGEVGEDGWDRFGLSAPRLTLMNGFAYLLTLGFRRASLLPASLAPAALALDDALAWMRRFAAMRALAVWERRTDGGRGDVPA
jgi:SAM-dependent methyltransferase